MKGKRQKIYSLSVAGVLLIFLLASAYTTWNRLDPEYTCAQCHEIAPSHALWAGSAHAGVQCIQCHGTALSNGFHSLKEKSRMVWVHVFGDKYNDDIHLTETQVLELSQRCIECHQSEYAGWLSSGHAVNYEEIFMDSLHNTMEKPYWDCFRCHGMFYDGDIHTLMSLSGESPQEWTIRDERQKSRATMPCLACHQIHTENPVSDRYISMSDTTGKTIRHPSTAHYIRADKEYLRSDHLTRVKIIDDSLIVNSATDNNTLLCMQCHSPNFQRHAGSEDDRTPTGVHEGISCTSCHKPHSNDTRESCAQCHSSLTAEQVDAVYANPHGYKTLHNISK
ncbi:multiheme c-type cytochrome [Proteiniphilum sp.]|uniref:multiheme c-type cytochrome n=1 Tax=Proteiniphilum sp. TaxID=1926877 RepID=UPI0033317219